MARKKYNSENPIAKKQNRTHNKAVRLLAKRAATLAAIMLCCIPKTVAKIETVEYEDGTTHVVNLDIKPNGNGSRVGPAHSEYTKLHNERKNYLREHYRTRTRSKTPWYMLTSGKCWNYETQESLDSKDYYKRKLSEQGEFHNKTIIKKFTRNDLIIGYLGSHMEDWKKLHPEPKTDDLFYNEEHPKWVTEYEEHHDKVVKMLVDNHITKYNKTTINAVLNSKHRLSEAA